MTHHLGYMQHYWETRKSPLNVVHAWGTKSDYLAGVIEPGDTLWIIVTGGPKYPEEWRLLQRIEIDHLYFDGENPYPYRVKGDPDQSKVFDPEGQDDLTPLLKNLEFASGRSIQLMGRRIGLTLQKIRSLSEADAILLENYSRGLKTVDKISPKQVT